MGSWALQRGYVYSLIAYEWVRGSPGGDTGILGSRITACPRVREHVYVAASRGLLAWSPSSRGDGHGRSHGALSWGLHFECVSRGDAGECLIMERLQSLCAPLRGCGSPFGNRVRTHERVPAVASVERAVLVLVESGFTPPASPIFFSPAVGAVEASRGPQ